MKVENMRSSRGNKIANQFILSGVTQTYKSRTGETIRPPTGELFQSYDSIICFKSYCGQCVILDRDKWDYSTTTSKYRNQFLNETKKETQKKIDAGVYILADLNK